MKKSIPFIPESIHTLKATMGYGFIFNLREQVNERYRALEYSEGSASVTDQVKYTDSITQTEYETDSPAYLKHFIRTLDKALSGEKNSDKEQYEASRILENPYSTLIFFDDQTEENDAYLSLLHHAAIGNNCDALNELSVFYAPPDNHHKYRVGVYSNSITATKLLFKASSLGSLDATQKLIAIYSGQSHIKAPKPCQDQLTTLKSTEAKQYIEKLSEKAIANKASDTYMLANLYDKAKDWYKNTLETGTEKPLKHEPLSSINRYYEKAYTAKLAGHDIDQEMAIKYLKTQTKNQRPYQRNGTEIAKPMFDLGVMYLKGINGLEQDDLKASSLFHTARAYDQNMTHEIEAMLLEQKIRINEPDTDPSPKKAYSPKFG